jgi:hypothetical protein
VIMTGPRVAIALRPSAATETARRLVAAAELAIEQAAGVPVQPLEGGAASND